MKSKALKTVRIPGFGAGLQKRDPYHMPLGALDLVKDMRVVGQALETLPHMWKADDGVTGGVLAIIPYRDPKGNDHIIVASPTRLKHLYLPANYTAGSYLTQYTVITVDSQISWDQSSDWLFVTTGSGKPLKWRGRSTTFAEIEGLDNVEGGTDALPWAVSSARLIKWFQGCCILLDTTENGVRYTSRVRNSNLYPDTLYPDKFVWKRAFASEAATYVDIDDTPGRIVAAEPLSNNLIIYKEDSVHRFFFKGEMLSDGTAVAFAHEPIEDEGFNDNAIGMHSVLPRKNDHILVGNHSIYLFDGSRFNDIGLNIKDDFFDDFDWDRKDDVHIIQRPDTGEIWILKPVATASTGDEAYILSADGAWSTVTLPEDASCMAFFMQEAYIPIEKLDTVFSGTCAPEIDNLDSAASGCPNYATIDEVGQLGVQKRFLIGGRAVPATGYVYYAEPTFATFAAGMIKREPEFKTIISDLGRPNVMKRIERIRGKYTKDASDLAPRFTVSGYDVDGNSTGSQGPTFFGKSIDVVGEHFEFDITMYNSNGLGRFYWLEVDYIEEGEF